MQINFIYIFIYLFIYLFDYVDQKKTNLCIFKRIEDLNLESCCIFSHTFLPLFLLCSHRLKIEPRFKHFFG